MSENRLAALAALCAAGVFLHLMGWPTPQGPFKPSPDFYAGLAAFLYIGGCCAYGLRGRGILRRRARFLVAAAAASVSLLAAERAARLLRLAETSGGQGPLQPAVEEMRAEGSRPARLGPAGPPSRGLVLGLGDSFAYGQGVRREETFLYLIQEALDRRAGRGSYAVINAAEPGWNTADEHDYLLAEGLALNPKLVILQLTLNDPEAQLYQIHPLTPFENLETRYLWRSHLFFMAVKAYNARLFPYEGYIKDLYEKNAPGRERFLTSFKGIARECRRRGIRPVLAVFPLFTDLREYPFRDIHAWLSKQGKAAGYRVADLLPAYQGSGLTAQELRVSRWDHHPNAAAHRIAAEEILKVLEKDLR